MCSSDLKLFVIDKNTFEKEFKFEDFGIKLVNENNKTIIDNLQWNGLAKKSGFELGDYITELKVENINRPNKDLVYPIAISVLLIFGYFNYRRSSLTSRS